MQPFTQENNFDVSFQLITERYEDCGEDFWLRQIGRYWSPAERLALFQLLHENNHQNNCLNVNQRLICKVYRNIRKDNLSITQKGLVKDRAKFIALDNVTFKVRESGQKKVRESGQKNVHAFVCGRTFEGIISSKDYTIPFRSTRDYLSTHSPIDSLKGLRKRIIDGSLKWSQVHYNPFINDTFVDNCNEPVYRAEYAFLAGNGQIWILR